MMPRMRAFLIVATLACSSLAVADEPPHPANLDWLVGSWTCQTVRYGGPLGTGARYTTDATFGWDPNGWFWYRFDRVSPDPGPAARGYIGWDPAKGARLLFELQPTAWGWAWDLGGDANREHYQGTAILRDGMHKLYRELRKEEPSFTNGVAVDDRALILDNCTRK
jgi:hypothetical protein